MESQIRFTSIFGHRQDLELGEAALGAIGMLLRDQPLSSEQPVSEKKEDADMAGVKTRGAVARTAAPCGPPFPQQLAPLGDRGAGCRSLSSIKIAVLPATSPYPRFRLSARCDRSSFVDDRQWRIVACGLRSARGLWRRHRSIRGDHTPTSPRSTGGEIIQQATVDPRCDHRNIEISPGLEECRFHGSTRSTPKCHQQIGHQFGGDSIRGKRFCGRRGHKP